MLRDDEVAFGDKLDAELQGTALWRAVAPGLEVGKQHRLLGEVLPADGGYARLTLARGGPLIQYNACRLRDEDGWEAARHGANQCLASGELAYRWVPEESPEFAEDFPALVDLVWKVMRQHTAPHVVDQDGKPYRRGRVGRATELQLLEQNICFEDAGQKTAWCELRRARR